MVIDFRIHLTVMILIAASVLHIRFAEASASWPNEPAGSTLISDFAFDAVTGDGWQNGSGFHAYRLRRDRAILSRQRRADGVSDRLPGGDRSGQHLSFPEWESNGSLLWVSGLN